MGEIEEDQSNFFGSELLANKRAASICEQNEKNSGLFNFIPATITDPIQQNKNTFGFLNSVQDVSNKGKLPDSQNIRGLFDMSKPKISIAEFGNLIQ